MDERDIMNNTVQSIYVLMECTDEYQGRNVVGDKGLYLNPDSISDEYNALGPWWYRLDKETKEDTEETLISILEAFKDDYDFDADYIEDKINNYNPRTRLFMRISYDVRGRRIVVDFSENPKEIPYYINLYRLTQKKEENCEEYNR